MNMMNDFFANGGHIGHANATFLNLIPRKAGAIYIADFKPINLLNGVCKIMTKFSKTEAPNVQTH